MRIIKPPPAGVSLWLPTRRRARRSIAAHAGIGLREASSSICLQGRRLPADQWPGGALYGDQPASSSQVPDEVETSIQDKIESAKKTAHHLAENELFTYNERISNLDFEGHFAELRQAGPKAIIDIQTALQISLNDMFTRRRKLLDIENEFKNMLYVDHFDFVLKTPSIK